jgi:hypothetical protein
MPAGNKTGPQGQGSRTGRKLGYCLGNDLPGFENDIGFGRSVRAGGHGSCHGKGRRRGNGRCLERNK